jgi:beta-glucanase (GH16 family)
MDLSAYTLVFEENFTQQTVQEVGKDWQNTLFWGQRTIDTNGELQIYVDSNYKGLGIQPFTVKGGKLTIRADRAPEAAVTALDGYRYTSGVITSERLFSSQYGYFEVRARLPRGRGLWPAIWLLPIDGTWPPEIDIVETVGHEPAHLYGTLHYGTEAAPQRRQPVAIAGAFDSSAGFHTYGVDWQPDRITWYYDGRKVGETRNEVRDQAMYLIVNLAVGGAWAGEPDAATRFPASMVVDHVRVWHRKRAPTVKRIPKSWGTPSKARFPKVSAAGAPVTTSWSYAMTPAETRIRAEGPWAWYVTGNAKPNAIVGSHAKYNELTGGRGDDVLTGRGGNDIFVFRMGDGFDVVTDFSNRPGNRDKIKLIGSRFASFEDVLSWSRQMGKDTLIRLGRRQAILLRDVRLADLSPEQFILAPG